jgi:hypothetical protein
VLVQTFSTGGTPSPRTGVHEPIPRRSGTPLSSVSAMPSASAVASVVATRSAGRGRRNVPIMFHLMTSVKPAVTKCPACARLHALLVFKCVSETVHARLPHSPAHT